MPDALPAVTVPFSLMNTALSFAMPSSVVAAECSSVSNSTVPFLLLISIGRIWLLKWPAAIAAAARLWLSTANASCCSRVMPHLVRDVLGGDAHVDGVERVGQRADHHVEHLVSPIRAPQRCVVDA